MMTKIILLGICVCIINLLLRQHEKAFVLPVNIVYIIVVVLLIFNSFIDSLGSISDLFSVSKTVNKVLICLYKSAAICILTKISGDLCKESGNAVVTDMIDLGGRIIMLSIAFPFIESIIKTASAFVT